MSRRAVVLRRSDNIYWGEPNTRERHGAEGSPFQMPARLADGLGLESGLGALYSAPFAPSPERCVQGISVPPRPVSGRRQNLGCWRSRALREPDVNHGENTVATVGQWEDRKLKPGGVPIVVSGGVSPEVSWRDRVASGLCNTGEKKHRCANCDSCSDVVKQSG